ncbi:MAG: transcriptional repressor LexA [Dehalococcoidia bacterium]|nr:transcriptional repressor LexA [Dehalococcoidia bacterium]
MAEVPSTRLRILNFIRKFLDERGYAPTVRDIARGCNISTPSVVQHHLNKLERQEYIHRDPEVFRSIQLVERKREAITRVPLLGTIAAGEPIPVPTPDTWTTIPEETLQLTKEVTQGKQGVYALKVKGSSMIDAFVDDGDIVLIQQTSTVEDGEVAAVWLKLEQEVTLKKVYHEAERIRLQPANQQMEPMYYKPEDVDIQGKVIGVLRKL